MFLNPLLARLSAFSALLILLSSFLAFFSAFCNRRSSFSFSASAGLSRTGTGIEFGPDTLVEFPGGPCFEGPNPLQVTRACINPTERRGRGKEDENVQNSCQSFSLSFLNLLQLLCSLIGSLLFISRIPMNVLVLLPATGRSVDAVTEIVLYIP